MTVLSAKQFSAETGFPLKLIRRLCRTGQLPHWKSGKVYLLDREQALARMQLLKEQVLTRPQVQALPVKRRNRTVTHAGPSDGSTGTERLKALMKMKKAHAAATAGPGTGGETRHGNASVIPILPQKVKP